MLPSLRSPRNIIKNNVSSFARAFKEIPQKCKFSNDSFNTFIECSPQTQFRKKQKDMKREKWTEAGFPKFLIFTYLSIKRLLTILLKEIRWANLITFMAKEEKEWCENRKGIFYLKERFFRNVSHNCIRKLPVIERDPSGQFSICVWSFYLHSPRWVVSPFLNFNLRNRKHVPCFSRVIQTRVEVWENEKCCGNTSRRRVFPQLFRVLPNFHDCLYNSIETRSTCFVFLLENNATRKRKTTC